MMFKNKPNQNSALERLIWIGVVDGRIDNEMIWPSKLKLIRACNEKGSKIREDGVNQAKENT